MFRNDYKYDFFIPIKYNFNKVRLGHGSAIFIHLTKNFKPTAGCIGLMERFPYIVKLINRIPKLKYTSFFDQIYLILFLKKLLRFQQQLSNQKTCPYLIH